MSDGENEGQEHEGEEQPEERGPEGLTPYQHEGGAGE